MPSKTSQFDKALDEVLKDLKPRQKECGNCKENFQIYEEDIDFYQMLRVPPPKLCPLCRKKRRFGHLMRVPKFFKKPCSAPGHTEEVITVFPPASPHKIYDFSYYHSDSWDAAEFGRQYNEAKQFFEQFKQLFFEVPHIALERDPYGVNCDYTLGGKGGKNNYYCAMGYQSQDCMYCLDGRFSNNLVDCSVIYKSELCYGSVSSTSCSRCIMAVGCSQCLDSAFIYECKNCSHCFMSSNLRNKSYVFENEQLTKEEYEKRIKLINLGDRKIFNEYSRKFVEMHGKAFHRAAQTVHCKNSIGDNLTEGDNCYFAFRGGKAENIRYLDNFENVKDSMDGTNMLGERIFESVLALGSKIHFSMYARNCTFMEYSSECLNCNYCFGCVGLKNKKFHIFNKPYSENEYYEKIDLIKTEMLKNGEYGEFFSLSLGLMPYQSSSGQYFFPLSEEEAQKQSIPWYDEPESRIPENMRLRYAPADVPQNIKEVSDDILSEAIICEITKKPFRLIGPELDFYRRMNLPIPTKHPWARLMERKEWKHPIWPYPFICPRCKEKSFSVYNQDQQAKLNILCEPCYLREVV